MMVFCRRRLAESFIKKRTGVVKIKRTGQVTNRVRVLSRTVYN